MLKTIVLLSALFSAGSALAAFPKSVCGKFKDNGAGFQIIDGRYNPYVDTDDGGTEIADSVVQAIYDQNPQGKCFCVIGQLASFDRAGKTAYMFASARSAKKCAK